MMRRLVATMAATGAVLGAAVGLAGPASAGPIEGAYTATITQIPPGQGAEVGQTMSVILTSCGPGCATLLSGSSTGWSGQLGLQGNTWSGPISNAHDGTACTGTLDDASLALTFDCPSIPVTVQYALARK